MGQESNNGRGYDFSRYAAGCLLLLYGFAKLTGAQFTVLDSELDKPLREVSGFWLTWYYFGYSPLYGNIIALVQIIGAIALLSRRTALIGACVLLPIVGNIVLIDLFYGIDIGALVVAVFIACCLVRIVASHRHRLESLLLPPGASTSNVRAILTLSVRICLVGGAFGFTYYVANYNNRAPTPIDGTWKIVASEPHDRHIPTRVYFERNRAFMCVFLYGTGASEDHHFEVARGRVVRIWSTWLTKGPLLWQGHYNESGDQLTLRGHLPDTSQPVMLVLAKVRGPHGAGG